MNYATVMPYKRKKAGGKRRRKRRRAGGFFGSLLKGGLGLIRRAAKSKKVRGIAHGLLDKGFKKVSGGGIRMAAGSRRRRRKARLVY